MNNEDLAVSIASIDPSVHIDDSVHEVIAVSPIEQKKSMQNYGKTNDELNSGAKEEADVPVDKPAYAINSEEEKQE